MTTRAQRQLLVDGDIFCFKCASASEKTVDWGGGQLTVSCDTIAAAGALDEWLSQIQTRLQSDSIVVALSAADSQSYFRRKIYAPYKQNRVARKPIGLVAMKEHVLSQYSTEQREGWEGDDVLGVLATSPERDPAVEQVIVSHDKDLLQIPGLHFNPAKDELVRVTVEMADYWHMLQTLTGDSSDGYPGCPGYGPVKARKLLDTVPHTYQAMWPLVVAAFKRSGKTVHDARVMAQVSRILRAENYNSQNKEVCLWQPPEEIGFSGWSEKSGRGNPPSPRSWRGITPTPDESLRKDSKTCFEPSV